MTSNEDINHSQNMNSNEAYKVNQITSQSEGKYIVNKLAKVIKSKGSSVKSRNSASKKNSSQNTNKNSFN